MYGKKKTKTKRMMFNDEDRKCQRLSETYAKYFFFFSTILDEEQRRITWSSVCYMINLGHFIFCTQLSSTT